MDPADAGCGAIYPGDGLPGLLAEAPMACRLCRPVDLALFSGSVPGLLGIEAAGPASENRFDDTLVCFLIAGGAGTSAGLAGAVASMDVDF